MAHPEDFDTLLVTVPVLLMFVAPEGLACH